MNSANFFFFYRRFTEYVEIMRNHLEREREGERDRYGKTSP
jgi:hypothetical protein